MRKVILKIGTILLITIFILQTNFVIAATKSQLNKNSNETDKKIEEAKEHLEGIKEEQSETMKQVEKIITEISQYQSQIDDLDTQINDLNKKIEEAQNNLNKAQNDYEKQEELLEARLVASYEAGETSYLDFLLSSESITDLISNYYLITELATTDAELLESIQKQKEDIEKAKQTLEEDKQKLASSRASKQSVATQLQNSKSQKDAYAAQLSAEEKQTQAELEQFEQDKRDIEAELRRIAEEEARKQAEINNNKKNNNSGGGSASNVPNNPSASGYIRPIVGYGITCGWYGYAGHTGVDFSGAGISGKPILAVKSGTVVTSTALKKPNGDYKSYGEYIVISHGDGTMTLYAHGAPGSRLVSPGQKVNQGQQIMSVGTTGNSTGYHLHFEVRVNGRPVNPTPYLP